MADSKAQTTIHPLGKVDTDPRSGIRPTCLVPKKRSLVHQDGLSLLSIVSLVLFV